jgi:hypothetical protein
VYPAKHWNAPILLLDLQRCAVLCTAVNVKHLPICLDYACCHCAAISHEKWYLIPCNKLSVLSWATITALRRYLYRSAIQLYHISVVWLFTQLVKGADTDVGKSEFLKRSHHEDSIDLADPLSVHVHMSYVSQWSSQPSCSSK